MNKKALFYSSIMLSLITLFFSISTFGGIFNQLIEVSAWEEVFEPEKALVIFFDALVVTFSLGIILAIFHLIIFIKFRKNTSLKIIPFDSLLKTDKVFLRCIFALFLLISIYGFNWIITRDYDIFYYLPFFVLFPICVYLLLNFTAANYNFSNKTKAPSQDSV